MNGKQKWLWYAAGLIPAVWLGLLIAPAASGGLPEILRQFPSAMNEPFHIEWCEDSLKTVLVFIALYAMVIGVYLSTRRHYRRGEEHGSAKWGNVETVNRKYRARPPKPNKVFTQHIRMGINGRKHKRNLNTVIIGGSGAGKTRSYAKPCLYEACLSPQGSSFVCLDPIGRGRVCLLFLVLLRCFIGLFLQLINCLQFLVGKEFVLGFVFARHCHGIRCQKPVVNGDRCNGVLGASVDIRRCAAVRGVRHQRMGHDVKLVVADR